jgi:predicted Zn-dependent peptidase
MSSMPSRIQKERDVIMEENRRSMDDETNRVLKSHRFGA